MVYRFVIIVSFVVTSAHAQSPLMLSLAGTTAPAHDSAFAPIAQASSSSLENSFLVALSATPAPFGLQELAHYSFACSQGFGTYALGFGADRSGDELFNETRFALSAAYTAQADIHFGSTFNIHHRTIAGYGSASAYSLDLSATVLVAPWFEWSSIVTNVSSSRIGQSSERLPTVFRTGLNLHAAEHISFVTELRSDIDSPFDLSLGILYLPYEIFSVRCGTAVMPSRFAFGFGIDAGIVTIEYAIDRHEALGFSHAIAVIKKL